MQRPPRPLALKEATRCAAFLWPCPQAKRDLDGAVDYYKKEAEPLVKWGAELDQLKQEEDELRRQVDAAQANLPILDTQAEEVTAALEAKQDKIEGKEGEINELVASLKEGPENEISELEKAFETEASSAEKAVRARPPMRCSAVSPTAGISSKNKSACGFRPCRKNNT